MLYDKIDVNLLKKEFFDINALQERVKQEFEATGLLLKGTFPKCSDVLAGSFNDKVWVFSNKISHTYIYFFFSRVDELKFKKVTQTDKTLIKCWVAENILKLKYAKSNGHDYGNVGNMQKQYNILIDFIEASNNFSEAFLDDSKGSMISAYFSAQKDVLSMKAIISYLDYIEDKVSFSRIENLYAYKNAIEDMIEKNGSLYKPRKLPGAKNIFLFSSYVKRFFYEDNVNEYLKLYYMPILLWWEITTVIPTRPSEFCIGIKRNALINENDNYYLKIDRVKEKIAKKNKTLPTLKRIKITKELYDLILSYINSTNKYGNTKTLVSYAALLSLRNMLVEIYPEITINSKRMGKSNKIDPGYFTLKDFYALLNSFYDSIIKGFYSDKLMDERILPGDTRHMAFTSLMLQGYSPVEIAIMGGHKTLNSLDNYTCSTNTYIDSEVVSAIKKHTSIKSTLPFMIMDVFAKMPAKCPSSIGMPAYIEDTQLGTCTADFKNQPFSCESSQCYKCSKWWCEATEANYRLLEDLIVKKINHNNKKIQGDIEFVLSLLKKLGLKVSDGKLVADHSVMMQIKKMGMQISANASDIIQMKTEILPQYTLSHDAIVASRLFHDNSTKIYLQEDNTDAKAQNQG